MIRSARSTLPTGDAPRLWCPASDPRRRNSSGSPKVSLRRQASTTSEQGVTLGARTRGTPSSRPSALIVERPIDEGIGVVVVALVLAVQEAHVVEVDRLSRRVGAERDAVGEPVQQELPRATSNAGLRPPGGDLGVVGGGNSLSIRPTGAQVLGPATHVHPEQ